MLGLASKGQVQILLKALQERGWLALLPQRQRAIAIIPDVRPAGYVLPPGLDAKLRAHCSETGDETADVVADAVALFLDEREADGELAA